MTIIDSANMRCDSCGAVANHPILSMPVNWVVDRFVKPIQHYCDLCGFQLKGVNAFQAIPVALVNIPGTQLCTKCGNKLFSKDCLCYNDLVNHPQHYGGDTVYEVIKVIFAWGLDNNFCLGNAIKYIARADKKTNPIEDLRKARWYIDREIQRREKGG